jgi:signal peptidase II
MRKRPSWTHAAVLLLLLVGTVGCDRVTKRVAADVLSDTAPRTYVSGMIRLEYAENTGGFLGLGTGWSQEARTAVFSVGNTILLLALILVALREGWSGPSLVGLTLFVAGGASNLFDRVVQGSVVDFVNVGVGTLRTGLFNVADVAIMLGMILTVGDGFLSKRHVQSQARPSDDAD